MVTGARRRPWIRRGAAAPHRVGGGRVGVGSITAFLLVLTALAGCASVPTSSPVQVLRRVGEGDTPVLPPGPVAPYQSAITGSAFGSRRLGQKNCLTGAAITARWQSATVAPPAPLCSAPCSMYGRMSTRQLCHGLPSGPRTNAGGKWLFACS